MPATEINKVFPTDRTPLKDCAFPDCNVRTNIRFREGRGRPVHACCRDHAERALGVGLGAANACQRQPERGMVAEPRADYDYTGRVHEARQVKEVTEMIDVSDEGLGRPVTHDDIERACVRMAWEPFHSHYHSEAERELLRARWLDLAGGLSQLLD